MAGFILKLNDAKIASGDQFKVDVFLNTGGAEVNAVEGVLSLSDLISLKSIKDGGSILSLWVQRPTLSADNQISFKGLAPGGYIGNDGFLFSLILEAKKSGKVVLGWKEGRILKNDGKGTAVEFQTSTLNINISEATEGRMAIILGEEDNIPPEEFIPVLTRDNNLFGGKWFLAFSAQDKGSGIDYYEISEDGRIWNRGESPYLLKDQSKVKTLLVKAVDRAGNERIVSMGAEGVWWTSKILFFVILILGITLFYLYFRLFHKKRANDI